MVRARSKSYQLTRPNQYKFKWKRGDKNFVQVTVYKKGKKPDTYKWGYFPGRMINVDIKKCFNEGADKVRIKIIDEKQFNL